jgi:hypothetical protein
VRVTRFAGSGTGEVEWEGGVEALTKEVPGVGTLGFSKVIETWDLIMDAGVTYRFTFTPTGPGALKMFLFSSVGTTGTFFVPRNQRVLESSGGVSYYLSPSNEEYGVVVVNENGLTADYNITVEQMAAPVGVGDGPTLRTGLATVSPNPSGGRVQFNFTLRDPGTVDFDIMDMAGRVVARIANQRREAGRWTESWDGRRGPGSEAAPGIYFVQMRVDGRRVGQSRIALIR